MGLWHNVVEYYFVTSSRRPAIYYVESIEASFVCSKLYRQHNILSLFLLQVQAGKTQTVNQVFEQQSEGLDGQDWIKS